MPWVCATNGFPREVLTVSQNGHCMVGAILIQLVFKRSIQYAEINVTAKLDVVCALA